MNDRPNQALRQQDLEMSEYYRQRTFWQSRANLRQLPHVIGEYPDDAAKLMSEIRKTWSH